MENFGHKGKSWAKKNIREPNYRRSWTLTKLKRKNYKLSKQMNNFIETEILTDTQLDRMRKLKRDLSSCSNMAIYRESLESGKTTLIGASSCKNKLCFICNWARQKNIRRKYKAWFEQNQTITEIHRITEGKTFLKYTTVTRWKNNKYPDWRLIGYSDYDLMHLTLTVPHFEGTGFNGELYYFKTLTQKYLRLRHECEDFKRLVFGGEYGIETKKNTNGHHIHIHSLLLVRRERQNRNKLHLAIFQHWNQITINKDVLKNTFSEEDKKGILKGNKLIDLQYIEKLSPKGSTWIDLQNIYTFTNEGEKSRGATWNSKEMIIAVMETISYHFEPYAFDKEKNRFDLPLMAELAPVLYKVRLYDKFGCLYGEKALNVSNDSDVSEEYQEVIEELVNEETGEISAGSKFWLTNPLFVRHIPEKDYAIELGNEAKRFARVLEVSTTKQAVKVMGEMIKEQFNHKH